MEDTTLGGLRSYQGRVSNTGRAFGRSWCNSYSRGQGRGFNLMKPKVWGKCEVLGSGV